MNVNVEVKFPPAIVWQQFKDGKITCVTSCVIRVVLANGCIRESVGAGSCQSCPPMDGIKNALKSSVTDGIKRTMALFGPSLGASLKDKSAGTKRSHSQSSVAPTYSSNGPLRSMVDFVAPPPQMHQRVPPNHHGGYAPTVHHASSNGTAVALHVPRPPHHALERPTVRPRFIEAEESASTMATGTAAMMAMTVATEDLQMASSLSDGDQAARAGVLLLAGYEISEEELRSFMDSA